MYINTSGNARHGQAFVRAIKDGVEQHIYGSGDDRVVVSNEKS
jgi:predicted ABC-class ATPase